jgi:predicted TIM-barrel fold metal-dependent hydrolase
MPDIRQRDPWPEFRKMFALKRFPQVWISASEPYDVSREKYPFRDAVPFFKAVYEEFGGKQLVWGTGYPRPRWMLPMDKELEFVDKILDFYSAEDRERLLGKNALGIWRFPT